METNYPRYARAITFSMLNKLGQLIPNWPQRYTIISTKRSHMQEKAYGTGCGPPYKYYPGPAMLNFRDLTRIGFSDI